MWGGMWFSSVWSKSHATDPIKLAAESLVDAITKWPDWVYRRVDSVHPLEGARGRLRHSIDCIPPPDPRLAYDEFERDRQYIDEVQGQLMVPLAFITKGAMRHLDVSQNDGAPIPLIGSEEACELMVEVLVGALVKSGVEETSLLRRVMKSLVTSVEEGNFDRTKRLISDETWGSWGEQRLWGKEISLDRPTQDLLMNLSTDFVLIGLIPASTSGTRQILKFSYFWVVDPEEKGLLRRAWDGVVTACRISPWELSLPMHMPAQTRSYHLEFQVPPELDIRELRLPDVPGSWDGEVRYPVDDSGIPVAHAHARFENDPTGSANIQLVVPRRGIWVAALSASILTAVVFLSALLLPNAMETLQQVGGNAAALLLAAPAVFVSFLIIPREPIFSSRMLNPLRVIIGLCALLLFTMAASLVGELNQPYLEIFWWRGALISLVSVIGLLLGERMGKFFFSVRTNNRTE